MITVKVTNKITKFLKFILPCSLVTLLMVNNVTAGPSIKVTPCKILNKKICVNKKAIPKAMQALLPEGTGVITPLKKVLITSGDFSEFPDNEEGTTGIKVPAGVKTTTVCHVTVGGQIECTVLTAFNECPSTMVLYDDSSKSSYECDLDCSGNPSGKPDSQGNCDCDVLYNTCDQLR